MHIHISKSSKAAGLLRVVCMMLLICLLLSACGKKEENNTGNDAVGQDVTDAVSAGPQEDEPEAAPSAWDLAFSTGKAGLEEISLWPDDFTGFTIGFTPGNKDALFDAATPVRTDEYGVEYYEIPGILATMLSGETARYCKPVSLGPDGAVLWKAPSLSGNGYALYIQRDRTLVAAAQSSVRGAADSDGRLARTLEEKINKEPNVSDGTIEYSADGRYLFFNDTDKWMGVRMSLDLPYMLDTWTGEFFLLASYPGIDQVLSMPQDADSGHRAFGPLDGHFTMDGRYLVAVMIGSNLPDWESGRRLMRYDLETGTVEHFDLDCKASRLMEYSDNRFLIYSSDRGWQNLTITGSQVTLEAYDWHGIPNSQLEIYHNLSGPAVALHYPLWANFSALSFLRNMPESDDDWLVLQNPNDETFETMTSAELSSLIDEEITKTRSMDVVATIMPGYGVKCWFAPVVPIPGTPYILAGVRGLVPYAESWRVFSRSEERGIILNTETLVIRPILFEYMTLDVGRSFVRDDIVMIDGTVYRLKQDVTAITELTEAETGKTLSGMNRGIPETSRKIETSEYAYRVTTAEAGKLVCANNGFRSLGFRVTNDFRVLDDGYRLTLTLDMAPDPDDRDPEIRRYMVPRALTEERMTEISNRLAKTDRKKIQKAYTKVKPEKLDSREDRDQLLAYYPSLREQPLFILREEYSETRNQEKLEGILRAAGYSAEEYEADRQLADMRSMAAATSFALTYIFRSDDPSLQWTAGTAGALCTLADHLASTVYRQYQTADPKPDSIESLPTQGSFTYEGITFNVALESIQEEEESLTLVFTVAPEDEWGRFLR